MREKENYRENLAALKEEFPKTKCLSVKEVGDYLGIDRRTVAKLIDEGKLSGANVGRGCTKIYRVSLQSLARFLS
jgi:excisionase family DNA binding protein